MRKKFSEIALKELNNNKDSVVLLGDISMGLFLDGEEKLHPRCLNVGILEQSMISMAAGLACKDMVPIVHTISAFLIERCLEQIKLDLVYNKNKAILISANGPYDYNKLGPTHHSANDVTLLDDIGVNNLFLPYSIGSLEAAMDQAKKVEEVSYIRLAKTALNEIDAFDDLENAKISVAPNNRKLSIFVGEAAVRAFGDECFESDSLFIHDLSQLPLVDMCKYHHVTFWEPYGRPIVAQKMLARCNDKIIESWCYPKAIESGIFDCIFFERTSVSTSALR